MSDFNAKMYQIQLRPCWGSLQRSPDALARFKGPTSKGGKERREWRGPLYFFMRIYAHESKYHNSIHEDASTVPICSINYFSISVI